jgi:hypothetical protein
MKKKNLLFILVILLIISVGFIIYNNQDIKTNTINVNPTNQPTEQTSSQQPQQTIANTPTSPQKLFDKEVANIQYVKEEVSQEIFKDKVIFPNVDKCPIYIVEPNDIDSTFLLDFAYDNDLSKVKTYLKETDIVKPEKDSKFGGNYTGQANYEEEHINLGYNKADGSMFIFYNDILRGKTNESIVDDDTNSFIDYSCNFIDNFVLEYDKNAVWIGEKNKYFHYIQDLTFEPLLNGINIFPGIVVFNKYNSTICGPRIETMINPSGIGGFSASRLYKIKEVLSDDVDIITFKKALEIYKNNSTEEFTYTKFCYCFDAIDNNHFYEVTDESGTYNIYQSLEHKTTPTWIFFTGEMYDRNDLEDNHGPRMIIDAQTGEIIDN